MGSKLMALLGSALFALGFGAGGFFFGVLPLADTAHTALSARHWQPVPATVLETSLERGSEGARSVHARYRYELGGRAYESFRVGVGSPISDNIGSWHHDWHRRLEKARREQRTVTAWVDPHQPQRAVLDRDVRWGLVLLHLPFAVLFPTIALGAAWFFIRSLGAPADSFGQRGADVPAPGELREGSAPTARALWFFAGFWCLIAFPLAGLVWMSRPGAGMMLFVSIFPLAGCGLLVLAWKQQARARRYQGTRATLSPAAPAAGQPLDVSIELPPHRLQDVAGDRFEIRLAQYRVDDEGSGSPQRLVHALSQPARVTRLVGGGALLSAHVELPADAPPTGALRSRERVLWQLELIESRSGETQNFEFTLGPAAQASRKSLGAAPAWPTARAHLPPPRLVEPADGDAPEEQGPLPLRVIEDGERWVVAFPRRLARGGAVAALLAAAWAFWWAREAFRGDDAWDSVWALIRYALGVAFAVLAVHWATRRWHVIAHDSGFAVDTGSALWRRIAHYTLSQARPIEKRYSYEMGTVEHYALYLKLPAGAAPLAPAVPLSTGADAIARRFWAALADRQGRFAAPGFQGGQQAGAAPGLAQRGAALLACAVFALAGLAAISLHPTFHLGDGVRAQQFMADWKIRMARLTPRGRLHDELISAQHHADHARLARALEQGGDPNTRANTGSTLLMLAARRGQMNHVETLLRHGADVNLRDEVSNDNRGDTALLVALYGGHEDVFRRLLGAGAKLDVKNMWDWGPVHMAAQGNCVPCLDELRRRGLPLHAPAPASRGETPAMLAAARGRLEALQWLVAHGADLRQNDAHGHDALGWALFKSEQRTAGWIRENRGAP